MKAPGALRAPLAGPPSLVGGPVGTFAGWALPTWFPARSRAGVRYGTAYPTGSRGSSGASGRSAPGPACPSGSPIPPEKWGERGRGQPPGPPVLMARSFPLAGFGGCAALFRWWGYYGAHVRALIWISHFAGAGVWVRKHFVAGGIPPAKASLGGKLSPEVTDEGATGLPNGAGENVVEATAVILFSTRKGWVQDRPLIRPSVRTGHLPPEGKALGVGNPPIGYPIPFRPTDSPGRAAGPGGSPQKRPKGPHLPFRPTNSPGRARLAEFSPPAGGERK